MESGRLAVKLLCVTLASIIVFSCSDIEDDPVIPHNPEQEAWTYSMINANNMNMPGSGKLGVNYSDSPSGSGIQKLADDDYSTSFSTKHAVFSIEWTGKESVILSGYSIVSGNGSPDMDPKSWKLFGSTGDSDWTELDSRSDVLFKERNGKLDFELENMPAYRNFRLDILANGGGEYTEIAEWYLYADVSGRVEISTENGNMPCSGILSAGNTGSPYGFGVANLMDGDIVTKYVARSAAFDIVWEGTEEFIPESYSISSAEDFPEKDPSGWILYASADMSEWKEIDSRSGIEFRRNEVKKFSLDEEEPYRYYKLEILSNNGSLSTQIAEWSMTAGIPNYIEDLMQYADGFTEASSTPMGTHYVGRHVTTDDDRGWLADPANEPTSSTTVSGVTWIETVVDLYPYGVPVPADVNQHAVGNCCALAVFASMAYLYPDFIQSIIKDNGDRTYDVSMYDPQGEPVTVSVSSKFLFANGSVAGVSGKGNRITWAAVLEKAIMKWNSIYKVNPTIDGIGSEHVAPLFTGNGNSFAFAPGKLTAEQMERAVVASLRMGKLVTGGFNKAKYAQEELGPYSPPAY